jgi:hypothetical protein
MGRPTRLQFAGHQMRQVEHRARSLGANHLTLLHILASAASTVTSPRSLLAAKASFRRRLVGVARGPVRSGGPSHPRSPCSQCSRQPRCLRTARQVRSGLRSVRRSEPTNRLCWGASGRPFQPQPDPVCARCKSPQGHGDCLPEGLASGTAHIAVSTNATCHDVARASTITPTQPLGAPASRRIFWIPLGGRPTVRTKQSRPSRTSYTKRLHGEKRVRALSNGTSRQARAR